MAGGRYVCRYNTLIILDRETNGTETSGRCEAAGDGDYIIRSITRSLETLSD